MARKEYIAELRTRAKQISAELEAINQILALEDGSTNEEPTANIPVTTHTQNGTNKKMVRRASLKPEGIPKGNSSWDDYWLVVLDAVGGRGKTSDFIEYAKKANPRIKENVIKISARTRFSQLYRDKKVGANKSFLRSEGYEYFKLPEAIDMTIKN